MKRISKILLILLLLIIIPISVYAEEDYDSWFNYDYEYVINKYDVNIKVNENNVLDIKETIGAYFNVDKHGIYRKIPLKNNVERLDGTSSIVRAVVDDVYVNDLYEVEKSFNEYTIKIGNPNQTLTGQKEYEIRYSYNLGEDAGKGYDELYINLIGPEWDTTIENISFNIEMPKEFDPNKVGFSYGFVGSTKTDNITYHVIGNSIKGTFNSKLYPGEGFTVRLELPEGYFVGATSNINTSGYKLVIIPIIFAFISFIIMKNNSDKKTNIVMNSNLPNEMNSLEASFYYHGKAYKNDVVSLLVYLANKGYIKIKEDPENKKGFIVEKIKDYDGNNEYEKIFFEGLFVNYHSNAADLRRVKALRKEAKERGEKLGFFDAMNIAQKEEEEKNKNVIVTSVSSSVLNCNFYQTVYRIIRLINKKSSINKIQTPTKGKKATIVIFIILSYIAISFIPFGITGLSEAEFAFSIMTLAFPPIGLTLFLLSLLTKMKLIKNTTFDMPIAAGILVGVCFGLFPLMGFLSEIIDVNMMYLYLYFVGLTAIAFMLVMYDKIILRTSFGTEMYNKVEGFRQYLLNTRKDELDSIVNTNPTCFFDILPYTYSLGISNKWMNKFKSIAIEPPTWYDYRTPWDYDHFNNFMNNTMKTAEHVMTNDPTDSSGGGGSSGGGSSGGGSGGGGGGSW